MAAIDGIQIVITIGPNLLLSNIHLIELSLSSNEAEPTIRLAMLLGPGPATTPRTATLYCYSCKMNDIGLRNFVLMYQRVACSEALEAPLTKRLMVSSGLP